MSSERRPVERPVKAETQGLHFRAARAGSEEGEAQSYEHGQSASRRLLVYLIGARLGSPLSERKISGTSDARATATMLF